MIPATTQKTLRLFSIVLLFLIGVLALAGGLRMIGDPQGKALGWSTEMLKYSPFDNYLISGFVLFVMNGMVSMSIAIVGIKKAKYYPLWIVLHGYILTCWILIQVIMIKHFNLPHLICGIAGILFIATGIFLMKYFMRNELSA